MAFLVIVLETLETETIELNGRLFFTELTGYFFNNGQTNALLQNDEKNGEVRERR